jgi:hypothetical protein
LVVSQPYLTVKMLDAHLKKDSVAFWYLLLSFIGKNLHRVSPPVRRAYIAADRICVPQGWSGRYV